MDNQSEPAGSDESQVSPQISPNQPKAPSQTFEKGLRGGIVVWIIIGFVVVLGFLIFGVFALLNGTFFTSEEPKGTSAQLILVGSTSASLEQTETTTGGETTEKIEATETEATATSTSVNSDNPIDIEADGIRLTYSRHELTTDLDGNPVIVVVFTFTNNTDKATSAMFGYIVNGFQDGVELDQLFYLRPDDPLNDLVLKNAMKEIKNGASIEIAFAFVTTSQSEVEIEAEKLFGSNDKVWTQIIPFPQ